ncbi:MAG: hypothetical protein AAGA92_05425 [Planctomycetota bacterium]
MKAPFDSAEIDKRHAGKLLEELKKGEAPQQFCVEPGYPVQWLQLAAACLARHAINVEPIEEGRPSMPSDFQDRLEAAVQAATMLASMFADSHEKQENFEWAYSRLEWKPGRVVVDGEELPL